jgi:hypothetical protein
MITEALAAGTAVREPSPNRASPGPDLSIDLFERALAGAGAKAATIGSPAALSDLLMGGVHRFGGSVRAMDRLNDTLLAPAAGPPAIASTAAPQPASGSQPLQSPIPPVALTDTQLRQAGFLVQMFDYAIEVNIILKAATQFVGSINQLTRGQ